MFSLEAQRLVDWTSPKFKDLGYSEGSLLKVSIRIVRNWPCEPQLSRWTEISRVVGLESSFELSPYFDSLELEKNIFHDSELTIIWLDENRLSDDVRQQLLGAACDLALSSGGKFLFLTSALSEQGGTLPSNLSVLHYPEAEEIENQEFLDMKYGHRFNSPVLSSVSRHLFFHGVSNTIFGTYRLLAVDFDNTLYEGVLGEDGLENLKFSDMHSALLAELNGIADAGCLLVGISKNDPADIEPLLEKMESLGLERRSFWKVIAGWDSKHKFLESALAEANLSASQAAFLDDNPGELEEMSRALPQVDLIDASKTAAALAILRSGHRLSRSQDANSEIRRQDLKFRLKRIDAAKANPNVHVALQSKVSSRLAVGEELTRAQELLLKTNQFNTSLKRSNVEAQAHTGLTRVAVANISDRMSDSGLTATMLVESKESELRILEFCISCRVLGRGLEDIIFVSLLESLIDGKSFDSITICWAAGPRNKPGLNWIKSVSGLDELLEDPVPVKFFAIEKIRESFDYKLVTGLRLEKNG